MPADPRQALVEAMARALWRSEVPGGVPGLVPFDQIAPNVRRRALTEMGHVLDALTTGEVLDAAADAATQDWLSGHTFASEDDASEAYERLLPKMRRALLAALRARPNDGGEG